MIRVIFCLLILLSASPSYAETFYSTDEVQKLFFPQGKFSPVELHVDRDLLKSIRKQTSMRLRPEKVTTWKVTQEGVLSGWFFEASVLGKHEDILFALALDEKGRVTHLEIMDYRETHGDEVRRDDWRSQFYGKTLGDNLKLSQGIDGISGATLSCRHLTDAVHALIIVWQQQLKSA